jgi:hypothetical protein
MIPQSTNPWWLASTAKCLRIGVGVTCGERLFRSGLNTLTDAVRWCLVAGEEEQFNVIF